MSMYPSRESLEQSGTLGRAQMHKLQRTLGSRLKPKPTAPPPGPPALVPYQPGFAMPEPMEALQDLSMAVAGRRRRSRLSIAGIGGM